MTPSEEEVADPGFCFIHMMIETSDGQQYFRCFECGHLFIHTEDLVNDHNALIREMIKAVPSDADVLEHNIRTIEQVEEICTCPHCTHDF